VYPFWHLELLRRVPPGPIEDEQDAFPCAGSHFFGEVLKSYREEVCVYGGQHEPVEISAFGACEGVEVGPLVTLVDLN
jgi:predicted phosphohydrolase